MSTRCVRDDRFVAVMRLARCRWRCPTMPSPRRYYKLGKLAWFLQRPVPAAAALQKAAAVLVVTHGDGDSPLVRSLLQLLDEARAEIRHLGL